MINRKKLFLELMTSVGLNTNIENYINGRLVSGLGKKITLIDLIA